jgi:hypothetical protein
MSVGAPNSQAAAFEDAIIHGLESSLNDRAAFVASVLVHGRGQARRGDLTSTCLNRADLIKALRGIGRLSYACAVSVITRHRR